MVTRSVTSRLTRASVSRTIGSDGGGGGVTPLLLDAYTAAAAAFALRKLRTEYAGSAIRVRRSSDSAERDIGFSGNGLDTASLLSFCGAGNGFVTKWYDQSTNTRDVFQATTSLQPQIVVSGALITQSSKPAIRFNEDWLQSSTFSNSLESVTVYVVAAESTEVASGGIFVLHPGTGSDFDSASSISLSTSNSDRVFGVVGGDGSSLSINKSGSGAAPLKDYWFLKNATEAAIRCDGAEVNSDDSFTAFATSIATQKILLGHRFLSGFPSTSTGKLNGWISEVVYWTVDQSAQITAIESAVNNHWGLQS